MHRKDKGLEALMMMDKKVERTISNVRHLKLVKLQQMKIREHSHSI